MASAAQRSVSYAPSIRVECLTMRHSSAKPLQEQADPVLDKLFHDQPRTDTILLSPPRVPLQPSAMANSPSGSSIPSNTSHSKVERMSPWLPQIQQTPNARIFFLAELASYSAGSVLTGPCWHCMTVRTLYACCSMSNGWSKREVVMLSACCSLLQPKLQGGPYARHQACLPPAACAQRPVFQATQLGLPSQKLPSMEILLHQSLHPASWMQRIPAP